MGIIQRQSIKNSLVNYAGIILGGLSTLFIYPLYWDLYGNIQFILSTATLFSTFFSLGSHSLVNKYFPYFKNNGIKGFLSLIAVYSLVNVVLVSIILYLFKLPFFELLEKGGFNSLQIANNLYAIFPLGILLVYITVIRAQAYNYERIVYPDIITNFSVKIAAPTIVLLSYFSVVSYKGAGWLLVVYHIIVLIWLMVYLKRIDALDFHRGVLRKVKKKKHIEMIRFMLYGSLNHLSEILVYKIDLVMIGLLLSPTKVGYYSIFLFLTVVIEIPTNAVVRITRPIISKAFEDNKVHEIYKIYKSSSTNLFIIGILLFSVLWMNMNTFFVVMTNGNDLIAFKTVFLFLAIAKLFEMVTSVNFTIISYSPHFRVNTLFFIILAVLNITLNLYLIKEFDIIGAAMSTAISMLIFNILKTTFIAVKYKMHPFRKEYILLLLFLAFSIGMPLYFPTLFESIILSAIISGVFCCIFALVTYQMKISLELNQMIDKYWGKVFNR